MSLSRSVDLANCNGKEERRASEPRSRSSVERSSYQVDHIRNEKGAHQSILGVVHHVHVKDVHGTVVHGLHRLHVQHHQVVDAFLYSDNNVKLLFGVLKAFRALFDTPVAVQHVQQPVLCVAVGKQKKRRLSERTRLDSGRRAGNLQLLVLRLQVAVDVLIACAELVNIRLVERHARQLDTLAGAVGAHVVALLGQEVVRLHGAVHVRGADHGHGQFARISHVSLAVRAKN